MPSLRNLIYRGYMNNILSTLEKTRNLYVKNKTQSNYRVEKLDILLSSELR